MRLLRDRSGVAALELALVAPIFITLMLFTVDMGIAVLSKAQIARAMAAGAEYATLAGQNTAKVATATIATNAARFAGAVTNAFLATAKVTTSVNNGAATGSVCCLGTTWTCSTTAGFQCADGSSPGTYLTITATYKFLPFFSADTYLIGKTLSETVVAPLQ